MNHPINKAMANLALSQNLVDKFNTPTQPEQPMESQQEMAQPQPEMQQPMGEAPQSTEVIAEKPIEKPDTLEAEANSVKDLENTLSTGFEAVSKLADAMKEVSGVKKGIAKRIKERLQNEKQDA